jgi:hypothetical protein
MTDIHPRPVRALSISAPESVWAPRHDPGTAPPLQSFGIRLSGFQIKTSVRCPSTSTVLESNSSSPRPNSFRKFHMIVPFSSPVFQMLQSKTPRWRSSARSWLQRVGELASLDLFIPSGGLRKYKEKVDGADQSVGLWEYWVKVEDLPIRLLIAAEMVGHKKTSTTSSADEPDRFYRFCSSRGARGRTRAQRLVSPLKLLARGVLLSLGVDTLVVVDVVLL